MHDMHQSCVDSFQKTKQKTAKIVVLIIIESEFVSKENINFHYSIQYRRKKSPKLFSDEIKKMYLDRVNLLM